MRISRLLFAIAAVAVLGGGAVAQPRLQGGGGPPALGGGGGGGTAGGGSAASSGDVLKTITLEQIVKVLQDSGYRAEVVQGSKRPYIRTGLSGRRVAIYMYDCEGNNCTAYQFSLLFNKTDRFNLEYANQWNKQKRYTKAYLDNDGDLNFEWDIALDGGLTTEYVKQTVLAFERYIGLFDNFKP